MEQEVRDKVEVAAAEQVDLRLEAILLIQELAVQDMFPIYLEAIDLMELQEAEELTDSPQEVMVAQIGLETILTEVMVVLEIVEDIAQAQPIHRALVEDLE